MKLPVGIQNNNPLNLIYTDKSKWKGLAGHNGRFCVFVSMPYGLRAAILNLRSYNKYGVCTLKAIVSRWAPPVENNTTGYIRRVCQETGWADSYKPNLYDEKDLHTLLRAMALVECGSAAKTHITDAHYKQAIMLANS